MSKNVNNNAKLVLYGEIYIIMFRADLEVNHFACLAFTKHGNIYVANKVLNIGSRHSIGDLFVLKLH